MGRFVASQRRGWVKLNRARDSLEEVGLN